MPIKNDVFTFLKVRGSYSEVGNAPTRYIAYQTYPYESASPTTATTYPNTDIKPERTKAWEVGLQSHFWNDKLELNVSLGFFQRICPFDRVRIEQANTEKESRVAELCQSSN